MKKWIAMLLALTLAAGMAACGGAPAETPKTTDPAQSQEEVTQSAGDGKVYSFTLADFQLIPGADFDPADLPEADSVFEVPSCAIEGTDNLYDYGTVEVTAFNDGDGEIIYSVYIKDANTPTDEGLYIGDTLEQVSAIYGTDRTENGNELVYTAGKTLLVIIVENDTVTSIEFRADI